MERILEAAQLSETYGTELLPALLQLALLYNKST
jgi:hypothetical protein